MAETDFLSLPKMVTMPRQAYFVTIGTLVNKMYILIRFLISMSTSLHLSVCLMKGPVGGAEPNTQHFFDLFREAIIIPR